MAKVRPLLGVLSGKLGDQVYSHNQGGDYVRAFVPPTGGPSALQNALRLKFATLSYAWQHTLTAADRDTWETYATNVDLEDSHGRKYFTRGRNHYLRSNVPRLVNLLARVDTAPTTYRLDMVNLSAVRMVGISASHVRVYFDYDDEWCHEDGAKLLLQVSHYQQPPTVNFFRGPYRTISGINGSSTSPPSFPQIKGLPGYWTSGYKGFWRARSTRADGRLSMPGYGFWLQP